MPVTNYTLHDPWWLLALLLLPLILWVRGRRGAPVLIVPFAGAWHKPSLIPTSRWAVSFALVGLVLLIIALARPQIVEDKREVKQQGYDLMLAIDLSGSMHAEDYERDGESINRLQAIKPVIQAFIHRRTSDRIGLVIFAGRAYTLAPLTFDHDWLAKQIERLKINLIPEDGTAIGDGLGVALTRLHQAGREEGNQRKGAFVVLMTDGSNNRGLLSPEQATEIAKSRGLPVYTIGVGREGLVRAPVFDENGRKIGYQRQISDLDEGALRNIADATGAKFFRAMDSDTIEKTFAAIDAAQKIEFQAKSYLLSTEIFLWFATPGAGLLFLGALFALPPQLPFGGAASTIPSANPGRAGSPQSGQPEETAVPSRAMIAITATLMLVNAVLGFLHGWRFYSSLGPAIGTCAMQIAIPVLVALLFSIMRRFRNARSRTKVVLWTSGVYLVGNLVSFLA